MPVGDGARARQWPSRARMYVDLPICTHSKMSCGLQNGSAGVRYASDECDTNGDDDDLPLAPVHSVHAPDLRWSRQAASRVKKGPRRLRARGPARTPANVRVRQARAWHGAARPTYGEHVQHQLGEEQRALLVEQVEGRVRGVVVDESLQLLRERYRDVGGRKREQQYRRRQQIPVSSDAEGRMAVRACHLSALPCCTHS